MTEQRMLLVSNLRLKQRLYVYLPWIHPDVVKMEVWDHEDSIKKPSQCDRITYLTSRSHILSINQKMRCICRARQMKPQHSSTLYS